MPNPSLAAIADRINRSAAAGGPTIVAIDGPAASGKTTLAERLATALPGPTTVLHMDDLVPGWDHLAEGPANLVDWILEPLARHRPPRFRRYDWVAGRFGDPEPLDPGRVLIVEGVGSGTRAAAAHLALLIWVEAPPDLRFERGMQRDGDVFRPHWQRWQRQEQALFAAEDTRGRADLILDGAAPIR